MNSSGMPHLRIGWRAFKAQPGVFFISLLMMFALWVALELAVFSIQRHFTLATWLGIEIWTVLHLTFLVVFSGLAAGLVVISGEVLSGREARLETLFGSMKRGPQVLLALCLYLLGVVAGLVLLVVPGIYFAVRYAMFGQVVATREVSAVESLRGGGSPFREPVAGDGRILDEGLAAQSCRGGIPGGGIAAHGARVAPGRSKLLSEPGTARRTVRLRADGAAAAIASFIPVLLCVPMSIVFPSLYAIIPGDFGGRTALGWAECLAEAGVEIIQYRGKFSPSREMLDTARELARLSSSKSFRLIVNDRADVAALSGAGGVHVGQEDIGVEIARRVCGAGCWVGVSTHSLEQVRAAAGTSADYIAVGPIFPTNTKENPDPVVGVEFVRRARGLTRKPLVAIGGITAERAEEVYRAGADSLAVAGDLLGSADPARRVEEYGAAARRASAARGETHASSGQVRKGS
jgi:thiamine-phosphate pyrophosphorylase